MNRNRLLLLAAAAGLAVAVGIVLVAVGAGTDSKSSSTGGASSASNHAHPLRGVPQHGDTLGEPNAPATLTVFEDPQCPFCREWNVNALAIVIGDFVRPGKLKLVYRGINIIGPNSTEGLRAIYAAAGQNKLWNLVEGLYDHQGTENSGWITNDLIRQVAVAAGANADSIVAGARSAKVTAQLQAAERDAAAANLRGTPTFILQRSLAPPQQLNAPLDASGFVAVLSSALQ
jgi:protein-disulfide isomerase